jgi:pimeloyl-ACP methyl ester carboxylesterase
LPGGIFEDVRLNRRDMLGAAAVMLGQSRAFGAAALPTEFPWSRQGHIARAGGRIHYAEMGAGPVIVLLPKLGGWIADWRHVAPLLASRFRVIALDLPGHGDSKMIGPPPEFQTVAESAALIKGALEELGVERFGIAGNSLGGLVGVAMAVFWPEQVTHLMLVSCALFAPMSRTDMLAREAQRPGVYDKDGQPVPRSLHDIGRRFGIVRRETHDEQNLSRAAAGPWVRASERGAGVSGIVDYLPRVDAPTLLVYGSAGSYHDFRAVGESRLKAVRVEIVPESGSFTHQDNPEYTARLMVSFFG